MPSMGGKPDGTLPRIFPALSAKPLRPGRLVLLVEKNCGHVLSTGSSPQRSHSDTPRVWIFPALGLLLCLGHFGVPSRRRFGRGQSGGELHFWSPGENPKNISPSCWSRTILLRKTIRYSDGRVFDLRLNRAGTQRPSTPGLSRFPGKSATRAAKISSVLRTWTGIFFRRPHAFHLQRRRLHDESINGFADFTRHTGDSFSAPSGRRSRRVVQRFRAGRGCRPTFQPRQPGLEGPLRIKSPYSLAHFPKKEMAVPFGPFYVAKINSRASYVLLRRGIGITGRKR